MKKRVKKFSGKESLQVPSGSANKNEMTVQRRKSHDRDVNRHVVIFKHVKMMSAVGPFKILSIFICSLHFI